ncbi:uncharacterized protein LOC132192762 [Neocloeon triangulifer]|uniref:uncharacterized protein LOC132192762 n=1 Tax=Neocloeon triangulifer TaxID=2078957 RepID=UPI00286F6F66|nr:uncharacterized protein LOC132192762 [Neocloeon triangulifer]
MHKRKARHLLLFLLFLLKGIFPQITAGANCTSKSANENSECRLINGGESYEPGESESCTCTNPKCHGKSSSLICNDDGQWYFTAKSDGTKFECHSCKNIDCVIKTNLFHNCIDVKRHYKNNEGYLKCTCKSDNKIKILTNCDAATGDFKIKNEVGTPSSCDEPTPTTTTTATTETLSSNSSDPKMENTRADESRRDVFIDIKESIPDNMENGLDKIIHFLDLHMNIMIVLVYICVAVILILLTILSYLLERFKKEMNQMNTKISTDLAVQFINNSDPYVLIVN